MADTVQIGIAAQDEDFVGLFDVIEVHRSTQGESGPYEELTAANYRAARIPKTSGDPPSPAVTGPSVTIVGEQLIFRVDEDPAKDITVTLTGVDPLTFAGIAAQIVTAGAGQLASYVDSVGLLVVETVGVGTGAQLRVLESAGSILVGLPTTEPSSLAQGKDARLSLVEGLHSYVFTDRAGSVSYFYKTRFRNAQAASVSDFSLAFQPAVSAGVGDDGTVCGRADLVHLDGRALVGQEIRIHTNFNGVLIDGKFMAGSDIIKSSDSSGRVEFLLVRGQRVTVALIGTDFVRDITVPIDLTIKVFNLLDPTLGGEDVFKVQVPTLVVAERRTL